MWRGGTCWAVTAEAVEGRIAGRRKQAKSWRDIRVRERESRDDDVGRAEVMDGGHDLEGGGERGDGTGGEGSVEDEVWNFRSC